MTDDDRALIEFLAARYAEDWGAARDRELAEGLHESRATRDVDAKRAILNRCVKALTLWPDVSHRELTHAGATLRDLGSVYSDHASYRPQRKPCGWRPSPR